MPKFATPGPYRPRRTAWRNSFYYQPVDGLPAKANSATLISAAQAANSADPVIRMVPFGQDNWNFGSESYYFVDSWPTGRAISRVAWSVQKPYASTAGPHLYWPDLRQQNAFRNTTFNQQVFGLPDYAVNLANGDRHAILWSEDTNELVEAIGYSGFSAAAEAVVTWDLNSYTLPVNGSAPAGVVAACIPVAPLMFTYQDLLDCGSTGDLGHVLGLSLYDYGTTFTWPARKTDGTISGGLPGGSILRLKSNFDLSTLPNNPLKAVARTLQKYGAVVYDRNFTRNQLLTPNDPAWPQGQSDLGVLLADKLPLSAFEVVDVSSVQGATNSIAVAGSVPAITATVKDADPATVGVTVRASARLSASVVSAAPTARFTATPSSGMVPLTVTFDASSSTDVDGGPVASYVWDFGDGTTGTGRVVTHTYETPGEYTADLTVTTVGGSVGIVADKLIDFLVPVSGSNTGTVTEHSDYFYDAIWGQGLPWLTDLFFAGVGGTVDSLGWQSDPGATRNGGYAGMGVVNIDQYLNGVSASVLYRGRTLEYSGPDTPLFSVSLECTQSDYNGYYGFFSQYLFSFNDSGLFVTATANDNSGFLGMLVTDQLVYSCVENDVLDFTLQWETGPNGQPLFSVVVLINDTETGTITIQTPSATPPEDYEVPLAAIDQIVFQRAADVAVTDIGLGLSTTQTDTMSDSATETINAGEHSPQPFATDRFREAIRYSHRAITRAELITPQGQRYLLPVTEGTLKIDRRNQVWRTADLTVGLDLVGTIEREAIDKLNVVASDIAIYTGLFYENDQVETTQVARLRLETLERQLGSATIKIAGRDYASMLDAHPITPDYTNKLRGLDLVSAIDLLISDSVPYRMPGMNTLLITTDTLPAWFVPTDTTFDGVNRLETILKWCEAAGVELLNLPTGTFYLRPKDQPAVAVLTVSDGDGGVLIDANEAFSRLDLYNAVNVSFSSPKQDTTPVRAFVYDNEPTSSTYWNGPFGRRVKDISDVPASTAQEAENAAVARLEEAKGINRGLRITGLRYPTLIPGDIIEVDLPNEATETHVVEAVTHNLAGATVEIETRFKA